MSIPKKLIKGAGISFAGKITGTGVKYLTQLSLANFLDAEAFGFYALGLSIYQVVELFSRVGLEVGGVRYVSIHYSRKDIGRLKGILWQTLSLPFIIGIFFSIILWLTADSIAASLFDKPNLGAVLKMFACSLPFGASVTAGSFATTGFQTTGIKALVWEFLLPLFNLSFIVCFHAAGFGLLGAVGAWVISVILSLMILSFCILRVFPELLDRQIKPVFEIVRVILFSLPLSLGSFLWLVLVWTDILMLGYFRPASEVGIYRAASQTALLMTLLSSSLVSIFSPMIANFFSQEEFEAARKLFQKTVRWNFALSMTLFLIVSVTSQDLLRVFGEEFEAGWLCLVILAAGQLTRAGAGGLAVHVLAMSGHQNLKLVGDLISAIMNIALNILLIPRWGILGAAVATGLSLLSINLIRLIQVNQVLGARDYEYGYLKTISISLIPAAMGLTIQAVLPSTHYLISALLVSFTILGIYIPLLVSIALDAEDRMALKKVANRLRYPPRL